MPCAANPQTGGDLSVAFIRLDLLLNLISQQHRRAAADDFRADLAERGELLIKARQVARGIDRLAVDILDHVAFLESQLARQAASGRLFEAHAAAGVYADMS